MRTRAEVLQEFGLALCDKGDTCTHYDCTGERAMADRIAQQEARIRELEAQLKRVVGEHSAPHDCYATGPLTGDPFSDLASCPSCEALALLKEVPRG